MELPGALLRPSLKNKKKKSTLKKILIFSQKKAFLVLWANGTIIFWEMERLSPSFKNIFKNRLLKKIDISLNETFRKWTLLAPGLKNGTYKAPKTKFSNIYIHK